MDSPIPFVPYIYKGPVCDAFGKCIATSWEGLTYASSPEKAKANLMYQFKVTSGRLPTSKIIFPGELFVKEGR